MWKRRNRSTQEAAGASSGAAGQEMSAINCWSGTMISAVYPGTFDPLTRGHEDLVRRASVLFGTVIIGVADSRAKKPFFTLTERVDIAKEVLKDVANVKVVGFSGLLINFLHEHNARGIKK